jgi:hypothetical protein
LVALLDVSALALEPLAVGFGGAQRLALRQQEVTGESRPSRLTSSPIVAGAADALEENDFHWNIPCSCPAIRRLGAPTISKPQRCALHE